MREAAQELKKRENLKRPIEKTTTSLDNINKEESNKRQKIDLSRNDLLLQKIKNNDPEIVRVELPYEEDSSFLSIVIKTLEKNTVVKKLIYMAATLVMMI